MLCLAFAVTANAWAAEGTNNNSSTTQPASAKSSETTPATSVTKDTRPYGKIPLLLTLTLSSPESVRAEKLKKIAEDQQQKAMAKEQSLKDLHAQIAAMENMIQAQQNQLEVSSAPRNVQAQAQPAANIRMDWIKPAIFLGSVLLAVLGLVWYRRYKTLRQSRREA